MKRCKRCNSYAINNHLHGRSGDNEELCDVCFWRDKTEKLLRSNESWPTKDILKKLIEASNILLIEKDYDGDGYEKIEYAKREAKKLIKYI